MTFSDKTMLAALRRWLAGQLTRLERTTMAALRIEERGAGFAVVAEWPATGAGPAGRWERVFDEGNVRDELRANRCRTRRGIAAAVLAARGLT